MNTLNLEAQKASLAHEILAITDERAINNIRSFLKSHVFRATKNFRERRKIGILDGKTEIKFSDDFEMTTDELLALQ
jgi:hypothetical protein